MLTELNTGRSDERCQATYNRRERRPAASTRISKIQDESKILPWHARFLFKMFGKDFILDPKPAAQKGSGSIGSSSSSGNKEIDLSDPSASGPVSLNTGYLSSLFNFTSIFSPILIWCSEIKVRISNKKCFKIVGKACGKLKSWCEGHISTGQVVVKGIGFACFGFLLFQKLSAWYRQIGET